MRIKTHLEVHLDRLAANYQKLKKITPSNEVLFMVKANAYGHGLLPITQFAQQDLGVREFGVASIGEAMELRNNLASHDCEVLVFSDLEFGIQKTLDYYHEKKIIPVIHNLIDLDIFLSKREYKYVPLCLKFNTGMNRLGFACKDVEIVANKLKQAGRKSIYHLMSHFSYSFSDITTNTSSHDQYGRFLDVKNMLSAAGISIEKTSMGCSGAIEQDIALGESHIRPGLMLYGPSSLSFKKRWDGEVISDLRVRVINILKVDEGMPIGYANLPSPGSGLLVMLAIGYGDGFSTHMIGARITHKGYEGIITGRVNMDMIMVLFPHAIEGHVKLDDTIEIWSRDTKKVIELSDHSKSIPYEVFCNLNVRIPRIYHLK